MIRSRIHPLVDRADRQQALHAAWAAQGIAVQGLHVASPRLEDAFVLMLNKTEEEERTTEESGASSPVRPARR